MGRLKGGLLKMWISHCNSHSTRGFRPEIRTQHVDFVLKFALLFLRQFHREGGLSRRNRALKNAILRSLGLRCRGLGLPQKRSRSSF